MTVRIIHGDSREKLRSLADASVDSVVCDPPYALVSITKRFANSPRSEATENTENPYGRTGRGFMGQRWDNGETAFDPAFWVEVLRVLKPGGHLVAFGGTRTYHRLVCAIEDAGFEVRDRILDLLAGDAAVQDFLATLNDDQAEAFFRCVADSAFGGDLAWVFGSGFPKSHDVSKGIDKAAGAARKANATGMPVKRMIAGADQNRTGWEKNNGRDEVPTITKAGTPDAERWEGWGTALKPAHEPILLARKPLGEKTVAANVLKYGTGAINVDASRIGVGEGGDRDGEESGARRYGDRGSTNFAPTPGPRGGDSKGRWPANVVHDGSDAVLAGFPEAGAFAPVLGTEPSKPAKNVYGDFARGGGAFHGDHGSAARFFYSAKADADDRLRSKHPTVKPVDLIAWLVKLVTPAGGVVLDPFAGSGTTGMACLREGFDAILIEREAEYVADIEYRLAHVSGADTPLFAGSEAAA